jgi:Fe-S-cluster containining protein
MPSGVLSLLPVGLSTIELLYIYHRISHTDQLNRFFRRGLDAQELWSKIYRQCSETSGPSCENNVREVALLRYYQQAQPCPFLHGGLCRIYPYRPIACRMHFSLSPPYWCSPSHFQNGNVVRFNLEPSEPVFEALDRTDARFQLDLSDVMISGLLELAVNIMQFEQIRCT